MRFVIPILALTAAVGLAGCGGRPADAPRTPAPLSVADWQKLPVEQKYDPETFERLKLGNPKLENQRAWDEFARTVIKPARDKDLPGGKPKP
jgi:hypothetical protein